MHQFSYQVDAFSICGYLMATTVRMHQRKRLFTFLHASNSMHDLQIRCLRRKHGARNAEDSFTRRGENVLLRSFCWRWHLNPLCICRRKRNWVEFWYLKSKVENLSAINLSRYLKWMAKLTGTGNMNAFNTKKNKNYSLNINLLNQIRMKY